MRSLILSASALALALSVGCGGDDDGDVASNGSGGKLNLGGSSASGNGGGLNVGGSAAGGGAAGGGVGGNGGDGYCGSKLTGTIRDFKIDHPDFEYTIDTDPGIVQDDLGADGKPVYAGSPATRRPRARPTSISGSTTSPASIRRSSCR